MIFKLTFEDKTEFAQAKNQLHLLQSYEADYEGFQDIEEVEEISNEEAKIIKLKNPDYDENDANDFSEYALYDLVMGNDFKIIGSTEI